MRKNVWEGNYELITYDIEQKVGKYGKTTAEFFGNH